MGKSIEEKDRDGGEKLEKKNKKSINGKEHDNGDPQNSDRHTCPTAIESSISIEKWQKVEKNLL